MRLLTGAAARHALSRSLAPVSRAVGAGLGPDGLGCLLGGVGVQRLETGCDVARHMATGEGPAFIAPKMLAELLVTAERELGDGTARLAILVHAIVEEAHRQIAAGRDAGALAGALAAFVRGLCRQIEAQARLDPDLVAVARSAGADAQLAQALATVALEIGADGTIEIAEGPDGLDVNRETGFVVDAVSVSASLPPLPLSTVNILVANEIIETFGHLAPVLEAFSAHGKALVLIARDVTGQALETLMVNRRTIGSRVVALKPAAVAAEAAETLADLAVATGAQVICSREGTSLSALRPAMLGRAESFRWTDGRATFTSPAGSADAIAARRRLLLAEAERKKYLSLDREMLLRRAARLTSRFAELRLAATPGCTVETRLRTSRRAAASVQSAMRSGSIAGGTSALASALLASAEDRSDPDAAAARCVAAGVAAIHRHLAAGRNCEAVSRLDAMAAMRSIAQAPGSTLVEDPVGLTTAIFRRAASAASVLIMTDAVLYRPRKTLKHV